MEMTWDIGIGEGYSTEYCLMVMLEKCKKALDNSNIAGALLTDLSKAFDCLNHNLLIAELAAYGFEYPTLAFIYSYVTGRKQRTKVNNSISAWADVIAGIPQGSILGPLIINVYLNNIFYFIDGNKLANYADDNTPYPIECNVDLVVNRMRGDMLILIKWFDDNFFYADKCLLLVTNHEVDVSINIDDEVTNGRKTTLMSTSLIFVT